MTRLAFLAAAAIAVTACATASPRSHIENRLIKFGLSEHRAECLALELDERLDRDDMNVVADYVGGLNRANSPREALSALLDIDNSKAATAIARAGIVCAFE